MRCSLRCLDIPKHFCLFVPKIPSIVLSGVKNCLLVGSWEEPSAYFTNRKQQSPASSFPWGMPTTSWSPEAATPARVKLIYLSTFKEIVHLLALLGPDDLGKLRGDVEGHLKASQLLLSFLGHGSWWKIAKWSTAQCCFLCLLRFLLTLRLAVEWKDLYSMHDDG